MYLSEKPRIIFLANHSKKLVLLGKKKKEKEKDITVISCYVLSLISLTYNYLPIVLWV